MTFRGRIIQPNPNFGNYHDYIRHCNLSSHSSVRNVLNMKVSSSLQSNVDHASPLFGRGQECQLIRQAYVRSRQQRGSYYSSDDSAAAASQQEFVLVQGHSGSGKTALIHSIMNEAIQEDSAIFLSGKFELCSFQHPYQVFVDAFARFPQMVLSQSSVAGDTGNHDIETQMRQAVHNAVGTEGKLLIRMIPALKDFIGQQDEECQVQGKDALHRLQFVFSKFVRAISSITPLVLFFDDLQWSDLASLNLLKALLESQPETDRPSSLLIVCAVRVEGLVDEADHIDHPQPSEAPAFPNYLKEFLEQTSSSTLINVNKISLGNLDEQATSHLVAERLGISPELSLKLGPIVFVLSEGNPFHVVQLLSPLLTSDTPHDDAELLQRLLNGEDIFEIAEADETVDELLRQRFLLLPQDAQHLLQVAACIGDSIDHPALYTVFEGDVTTVEDALQVSADKGFLVFEPRHCLCRFTHDRVRQVVLSVIDDVKALSFDIGYKLWTKSSPMFLTNKMFVVANLLNHGTDLLQGQAERYKAAAINLEAGSNAVSLSAFQDAARFLNAGIDFLRCGEHWKDEYELSLNLISAAAEAHLCNQRYDLIQPLVHEILEQARCVKDKLRAYVVQINSLGQRCNMEAATRVGVDVMRQLGEPLPQSVSTTTILLEIAKTRIALRGRSNDTLLALPPMRDQNKLACTYVLTNLMPYAFQASSNFVVVIAARLVRLCLKYGMNKWSANGFSAFAFVICPVNRKEGYRLGELALQIVERYGARELLPRIYVNFYGLVHHWRYPLEGCLEHLEVASKVGMEVGDVEHATLAFTTLGTYSLYHGKPLEQVQTILDEAILRMRILQQDGLIAILEQSRQFVNLLMGNIPLTSYLTGEALPFSESSPDIDSKLIPYGHYFFMAELAYMFGDLDLASQMLERNRGLQFEPLASYLYIKMRFLEALICTGLVRNGLPGRKRNISIAKRDLKLLKAWAVDCPQNFLHKQQLVEAELESLRITSNDRKGQCRVQKLYELAAKGSLDHGFLQEAAMANELAGNFMSNLNESSVATELWGEAHALYLQWGAAAKANHLSSTCIN